jgi:HPr kinase/phosphorylase
MIRQIACARLFSELNGKLNWAWVGGKDGGNRLIKAEPTGQGTVGVVGHMNFIHPFQIQVLGQVEFDYLAKLDEDTQNQTLVQLDNEGLAAIVVAGSQTVPPSLLAMADSKQIAVFSCPEASPHVIDVIRLFLARSLAESTTMHGVFLDVLELGVLITGASAIGKSELALELISRGHGLIADDIVELYRTSPDMIEGRCPAILRDFLEVRGVGILDIRAIFGETAIRPRKSLKLIVHLEDHSNEKWTQLDRLSVNATYQDILAVPVRKISLPVAAGRNLAVLIEAAVRNFVLNLRGIDSTQSFINRQQSLMNAENNE